MKTLYRIRSLDGRISKDFSTYQGAVMWLWNYCYTWRLESSNLSWTEDVPSVKVFTFKVSPIEE